ncbi:hypothetical protein ABK040_007953 [Willaertia magna]
MSNTTTTGTNAATTNHFLAPIMTTITNMITGHTTTTNTTNNTTTTPGTPSTQQRDETVSFENIIMNPLPKVIESIHYYNPNNIILTSKHYKLDENTMQEEVVEDIDTDLANDHSIPTIIQKYLKPIGVVHIKREITEEQRNVQWSPNLLPCLQFQAKHFHKRQKSHFVSYFEVKLLNTEYNKVDAPEMAIGFAPINFKGMVGWNNETIGFHLDNGRVYDERDMTNNIADKVFLTNVQKGDVIGCMIDHYHGEFNVTKNGRIVKNLKGNNFIHEHFKKSNYLPTISCSNIEVEFEVNLGLDPVGHPFMFHSIIYFKEQERLYHSLNRNVLSDIDMIITNHDEDIYH